MSGEERSVTTCTKGTNVAGLINHADRCRPEAQQGLNTLELCARGYMLGIHPDHAGKKIPVSHHSDNNDFYGTFYFSQSGF